MLRVQAESIHRSRLAFSTSILEHYLEGRTSWFFDVQPSYERDEVWKRLGGAPCLPLVKHPRLIFQVNASNRGIVDNRNQQPMFVSEIEFVNGPDGKIPSIIGLYIVKDEIEEVRTGGVYLQFPQRGFKLISFEKTGELGALPVPSGNQSSCSFKPSMIESTLQIVNSIPDDCGQFIKGISVASFLEIALNEFAASLRIDIGSTYQSVLQDADCAFGFRNVLIGPFDLESGTFVGGHSGESYPSNGV